MSLLSRLFKIPRIHVGKFFREPRRIYQPNRRYSGKKLNMPANRPESIEGNNPFFWQENPEPCESIVGVLAGLF
jgi:hypothetical protein